MKKLLLTLAIFLFSSSLYAFQTPDFLNGFYGGVGYAYQLKGNQIRRYQNYFKTNYKHIPNIFIGYKFNDYFSMDIQYNQFIKKNNVDQPTCYDCYQPKNGSNKAQSIVQNFNFYYPINEHHKPFITLGVGIQKIIHNQDYDMIVNETKYQYEGLFYNLGLGYEYSLNKNNSFIINSNMNINNKLYVHGSEKGSHEEDNTYSYFQQDKFQATYNIGVAYKYTFDNR